MILNKKTAIISTALIGCLLVSACGARKTAPYGKFSGKQLVEWGTNAPTTSCADLYRQKKTIQGLKGGAYKTSYGLGSLLEIVGVETLKKIDAQSERCPELHNSRVQNLKKYFTG